MRNLVRIHSTRLAAWWRDWRNCIAECKEKEIVCLDKYRKFSPER